MTETAEKRPSYDEAMAPLRAEWKGEVDDDLAALRDELALANKLRAARLSIGLTQQQAARLTGEDQGDISRFESGRLNPTVKRLGRYLAALEDAARGGRAAVFTTSPLASVINAAHYFLEIQGELAAITSLKLQKLLYYGQGYSLGLQGRRLFPDRIKAWEHGPVVPKIWHLYKDYGATPLPRPADFDPFALDPQARLMLERVYADLGELPALRLVELTHAERPWKETPRDAEIPVDVIAEDFRTRLSTGALEASR